MRLLLLLLAVGSAYLCWVCIALAMPRHWVVFQRASGPPAGQLRSLAVVFCGTSLGLCLWRDAPGFAVLMWVCLNSVGAWLGVGTWTAIASSTRVRPAGRR